MGILHIKPSTNTVVELGLNTTGAGSLRSLPLKIASVKDGIWPNIYGPNSGRWDGIDFEVALAQARLKQQ